MYQWNYITLSPIWGRVPVNKIGSFLVFQSRKLPYRVVSDYQLFWLRQAAKDTAQKHREVGIGNAGECGVGRDILDAACGWYHVSFVHSASAMVPTDIKAHYLIVRRRSEQFLAIGCVRFESEANVCVRVPAWGG